MTLVWMIQLAHASPEAALAQAITACATSPIHPLPTLSPDQRARLLAGEVVRTLDRRGDDEPSAAVGFALLRADRDALWIASQDPHTQVDPDLTEFVVEHLSGDRALWYGHIDLPRPLRDRQWVVESSNNHAMARATHDRCWEHAWTLDEGGLERIRPVVEAQHPRGITPTHLDESIYTPINRGSWFMAPLGDGRVLVAYQAATVVAGVIPDWLVNQLAMARLEDVLRSLEERAHTWASSHYVGDHPPVYGGQGAPIPPLGG
ncbi:MAG TPA: hypothetical protein ENK18_14090 [Deltaproteobacteria bacterium]|nr:hypothetical protein [Deltaproteobacteria bacterium]